MGLSNRNKAFIVNRQHFLQYVLFHFSELLTMCKPVEQNIYKP